MTCSLLCYACRPGRDWADFQGLLARGDVGLTIYRYRPPPDGNRTSRVPREMFILYTTRNINAEQHRQMNLDLCETDMPKCVNYCPRCKEMMRRIEALFVDGPSTTQRSDLCEMFSCPPCTDIVRKFRKFTVDTSIREHDSELIHLERLTAPEYDLESKIKSLFDKAEVFKTPGGLKDRDGNIIYKDESFKNKDGNLKDKEGNITHKDESLKDKDESVKIQGREAKTAKTNNLKGNVGKAKERQDTQGRNASALKTNNSKLTTGKAKGTERQEYDKTNKDVKLRKSIDEGSKATTSKDAKKAAVSNITKDESKLGKRGGIQKNASDSRITANELAASKSKKGLSSKTQSMANLGEQKNSNLEPGLMRKKIDEHMREKKPKIIEAKGKNIDDTTHNAAEVQRQAMARAMQLIAVDQESVDRTTDELECPQYEKGQQDIIKGDRVYKISKRDVVKQEKVEPAIQPQPVKSTRPPPARPLSADKTTQQQQRVVESSSSKRDGVMRYSLSEQKYINRGWTILPKEMVMRKVPVFLMRPARKNDWLEMNKHKKLLVYPSGEPLATFEENRTRLYYRSGEVALEFYKAEDITNGNRVVVYSAGKPEAGRAQPRTVLAVFDYSGNGAVYDHAGQIRLKYSQSEGVVVDRTIGPHTHWKWHNLEDSQHLHTVIIENEPLIKDHTILEYKDQIKYEKTMPDDAAMRGIEAQNVIKQTKKSLKKYATFQIKMKAVKINEYFSLKIFEQNSIFLSFSDGKTHVKINVGMVLDPSVVVGEDFVEVGEVRSGIEGKLDCSESVERLQRVVQEARAAERARLLRERRLNDTPSYLFQKHQKRCF